MEILLVNPTKLGADGTPIKYRRAFLPPLALATIHALTPDPHRVTVVNDVAEDIDFDGPWDLVGLTAMTAQVNRAYQIADAFRARGTKVVVGGIHSTVRPDEVLEHADAVMVGEVEDTWETVLADMEAGRPHGIYRPETLPDLQRLVIPRFDAFDLDLYPRPIGRTYPMLPIYTTRGCPFGCEFCSVTRYFGTKYRVKPIANVLAEMDTVRGEFYFFVDDNVVGQPAYARELFGELKKRDVRWMSQASTTLLKSPELFDLAAEAGCEMLFLGIESINESSLDSVSKGFNSPEHYAELFARLRASGIIPYASIIFGFDTDTKEQLRRTIDFLLEHKVGHAAFSVLTPLPGTTLFEKWQETGRITSSDWSQYDLNHVLFEPRNFTAQELLDGYWGAFQEFYSWTNIARRIYYDVTISRHPVMRFFKDVNVNSFFRSMVQAREHPYSGGIGRISGTAS